MKAVSCMLVAILASAPFACCTAYGEHPILLSGEKAIIVWNPEKKLQHFIRQASFQGEARDFGFIVPTPSKAEITWKLTE